MSTTQNDILFECNDCGDEADPEHNDGIIELCRECFYDRSYARVGY